MACFLTSKCRNDELWFVNNPHLEHEVLAQLAKWSTIHQIKLYGFAIEGNHLHLPARFPLANRADFMRDFLSSTAKAVIKCTPEFPGGHVFARRYSSELLPANEDLLQKVLYTALQPVKDRLVLKISDYPGYNFFSDAINGVERRFKVTNWKDFNAAKKIDPSAKITDFQEEYPLKFERIPGFEHMSQQEYSKFLLDLLETSRISIVQEAIDAGLGFLGPDRMREIKRGAKPINPKKSTRTSHRPRILSLCPIRRAQYIAWYFDIYFKYKDASKRYRSGELDVEFPKGTYKPYVKPQPP